MTTKTLLDKEKAAISLIRAFAKGAAQPIEVAYSGGKDSDVILRLVQKSGVEYKAFYKNTTIDPPGTIAHAIANGVQVLTPQTSFFKLIEKAGLPHRMRRTCCSFLKEYKVLDYCVIGVRKEESQKRKNRYKEPIVCRVYPKGGKAQHCYPILDWTTEDVVEYIKKEGIQLHPLYYDVNGIIDGERRLGCLACPLKSKSKRIADFVKFPRLVRAYHKALCAFRTQHQESKSVARFNSAAQQLAADIFYDGKIEKTQELFARNCKEELETAFNVSLIEEE